MNLPDRNLPSAILTIRDKRCSLVSRLDIERVEKGEKVLQPYSAGVVVTHHVLHPASSLVTPYLGRYA